MKPTDRNGHAMPWMVPGAQRLVDGLDHPEGLALDRRDNLWVGGEAGQVYRVTLDDSEVETIAHTGGTCLGLAVGDDGGVVVCDPSRQALVSVAPDGAMSILCDEVEGSPLRGPNWPVFAPDGTLYVSCSGTWHRGDGSVLAVSPDGRVRTLVTGLHMPNGMAFGPDARTLYVAESCEDRVISVDPATGRWEVFCDGLAHLPDGIATAANGDLFITAFSTNAIYRVGAAGGSEIVARDEWGLELSHPTNAAFWGSDLLIANHALRHVTRLSVGVEGLPLYGGPR